MSQGAGSDSDDADAMAAQLLSQFQGFVPVNAPKNEIRTDEVQESPQPDSLQPDLPQPTGQSLEIAVPVVENPSEYEYLPGHHTVRWIMKIESRNPDGPVYNVRLGSGERELITHRRLIQLEYGTQALEDFERFSLEDPIVRGKRHRKLRPGMYLDGNASSESDSPSEPESSEPDEATETRSTRSTRSSRRLTAAPRTFKQYFADSDSDGEPNADGAASSDDELSFPRTRQRQKAKLRAKRGRTASSSDGYPEQARGTRRSTRTTQRKSMRERYEDDLSDMETTTPRRVKYSGAREVFRKIPLDDPFRERHFGCCDTCGVYADDEEKGPLVFCQGCTSSYHQHCLGPRGSREHLVTKVAEDNFILQCRRCLGISHQKHDIRPHLGRCSDRQCREKGLMSEPLRERLTSKEEQQQRNDNGGKDPVTEIDNALVNNVDNVFFRCTGCQRAFHVEHLPPVGESNVSDQFDHYSTHWQCHDCTDLPGEVDLLLAWRTVQSGTDQQPTTLDVQLVPEIEKEYLIKWKAKSYFRVSWVPGDWVWGHCNHAMIRAFEKSPKSSKPVYTTAEAVPEENLRIDILFDVQWSPNAKTDADKKNPAMVAEAFAKYKGLNYEDSVWEVAPKPGDTERWKDFTTAFEEWLRRAMVRLPNRPTLKRHFEIFRTLNFEAQLLLKEQPELLTGGELMSYQLEGVNWLYYMLYQQKNAILADDMGLGKTVQVIGLFATLIRKHTCWPFLVVVPNSTVPNWRREINRWAPEIQVATYFGTDFQRQMVKDQEMFPGGDRNLHCHVVIASYETMINENAKIVLSKIQFTGLIVDEGHRLKNDETKLYESLSRMKFDFKVLLTGTPLQNNIRELFNLIQFLDPAMNAEHLEQQYKELNKENIRALHDIIRPCFLRRTKGEVLPFLPPMVQIIVPVGMSLLQKKLYKSILGKNPELIKAICLRRSTHLKQQEKFNLNNILIQLRKCLCHPFVYNSEIEEVTNDSKLAHQRLVEASGKFQLLSLMLPKLREQGHRVLIFSQFLHNIDLVEDFLTGLDLLYCRLDGKLSAREKQEQIDRFNAPNSPYFAFLLSTRSGGVGINLATADTVIIMDPDFNPKQDMQALSRAHRIGQKNPVLVYHLTTRGSVEEKIMEKGKKKVALEHVLIERLQDEGEEEEEDLESILRHGAQALFDNDDEEDDSYTPEAIDALLVRSNVEQTETACEVSSSSAQPQFNFARVWQKDRNTLEEVSVSEDAPADPTVWDKILQERERHAQMIASLPEKDFGRGKRKRPEVSYGLTDEGAELEGVTSSVENTPVKKSKWTPSETDDDFRGEDFRADDGSSDTSEVEPVEETDSEERPAKRHKVERRRPFKRATVPKNRYLGLDGAMDTPFATCIACTERHPLGQCPLKAAGVENCPLCGIAHFGGRRVCPHLHSRIQIQRMLDALARSPEPLYLVNQAKKYLKGVLNNMNTELRRASKPLVQPSNPSLSSTSSPQAPILSAVTQAPANSQFAQNAPLPQNTSSMPFNQTISPQTLSAQGLIGTAQPASYGLTLEQAARLPPLSAFNHQKSPSASVQRPHASQDDIIDLTGPNSPPLSSFPQDR